MANRRRQLSTAAIVVLALLAPVAALIGGLVFDSERITTYWTAMQVRDGQTNITEVIDYDFGPSARRGIFRTIPDLAPSTEVRVSSETAPVTTQISFSPTPTIRIGDPDQTIRGRHRYRIDYDLTTLVRDDQLWWNAVGTEWPVSIASAEIHVLSDRELIDPRCDSGQRGSFGGCSVEQIEPGHLLVETGRLSSREGVTILAGLGRQLGAVPSVEVPANQPLSSGLSVVVPMFVAFFAALAASPLVGRVVRRRGREQILQTTAHQLGYVDDIQSFDSVRLADESEMARLVYPSLVPPQGISAPQGGILMAERVKPDHKVAWLAEAAALDELVILRDGDTVSLRRGPKAPRMSTRRSIDAIFRMGDEFRLDEYDASFAKAWKDLDGELEAWQERSGFWDSAADRRRLVATLAGVVFMVVSAVVIAILAGFTTRWSPLWLVPLLFPALLFGSAITILARSWELRVRTPEGTSKWIETEALRRFLSELEPESALNMIEPDRFAGYTPWALTFGLEDKWEQIVKVLKSDQRFRDVPDRHFHIATMGPYLSHSTRSASTAPSSSGGGGGGGGSGGGGGGGGGGSW